MRTGSNFLEANLNAFETITCHGEAFNPHFLGYPKTKDILGISQDKRDRDPNILLNAIKADQTALSGFRYFHDHDPRVLDTLLDDASCAKIILTRNPLESYISWKIAQATGQWKLTDAKARKEGKATFDGDEFSQYLEALQDFQIMLLNRLQTSGQTAFYIAYEDLQSVEVMNGLATFLGVDETLEALDKNLKKQNPSPLSTKVRNFTEMEQGLTKLDRFNLTRTPNFEPRRGPVVSTYVTAAEAPVLFLPIKGGPEAQILRWMADLDGTKPNKLGRKLTQKDLRQWKRKQGAHRSFTVLSHPVARAHRVFCHRILNSGQGGYAGLRQTLRRRYQLPIPEEMPDATYDIVAHRAAFASFLMFLKGNLAGQTAIRVDAEWCSQCQAMQGFGEFAFPDRVIRESDLNEELAELATSLGLTPVNVGDVVADSPFQLGDIYDAEIEKLTQAAYQRDYMMFGFGDWA